MIRVSIGKYIKDFKLSNSLISRSMIKIEDFFLAHSYRPWWDFICLPTLEGISSQIISENTYIHHSKIVYLRNCFLILNLFIFSLKRLVLTWLISIRRGWINHCNNGMYTVEITSIVSLFFMLYDENHTNIRSFHWKKKLLRRTSFCDRNNLPWMSDSFNTLPILWLYRSRSEY